MGTSTAEVPYSGHEIIVTNISLYKEYNVCSLKRSTATFYGPKPYFFVLLVANMSAYHPVTTC